MFWSTAGHKESMWNSHSPGHFYTSMHCVWLTDNVSIQALLTKVECMANNLYTTIVYFGPLGANFFYLMDHNSSQTQCRPEHRL